MVCAFKNHQAAAIPKADSTGPDFTFRAANDVRPVEMRRATPAATIAIANRVWPCETDGEILVKTNSVLRRNQSAPPKIPTRATVLALTMDLRVTQIAAITHAIASSSRR